MGQRHKRKGLKTRRTLSRARTRAATEKAAAIEAAADAYVKDYWAGFIPRAYLPLGFKTPGAQRNCPDCGTLGQVYERRRDSPYPRTLTCQRCKGEGVLIDHGWKLASVEPILPHDPKWDEMKERFRCQSVQSQVQILYRDYRTQQHGFLRSVQSLLVAG